MTYNTVDQSVSDGLLVELYDFTRGQGRWFFNTSELDVVYAGHTFVPAPITRDRIKVTDDLFKNGISLSFPRDHEFASQYLGVAPDEVTTLQILRGHLSDPDDEFIVYWKGRVVGAEASENKLDLECESIYTSIRRPGLRARFELNCRHVLFQKGCNLDRELFRTEGVVTSVDGELISVDTASTKPDGFFTGGMVIVNGITRFITSHVGDFITLSRPLDMDVGSDIILYPGCDHTLATCKNKFHNLVNNGSFPFIPTRNPFDGSSIV